METLAPVKKERNISIVQNAFNHFLNGDIASILDLSTDDIEWSSYNNPVVPFSKTYHGKQGAGDFFSTLASTVDYARFEPRDYYADRDSVFVRGQHQARVKATGKEFGHEFLMHFKLREGKISSFFAFVDSRDEGEAFTK